MDGGRRRRWGEQATCDTATQRADGNQCPRAQQEDVGQDRGDPERRQARVRSELLEKQVKLLEERLEMLQKIKLEELQEVQLELQVLKVKQQDQQQVERLRASQQERRSD